MRETEKTSGRIDKLISLMKGNSSMLIVIQDNPDPDSIASAAALRELAHVLAGVQCSIACGGIVGRAENRAMLRYLGLNLRPYEEIDPLKFDLVALVDTQPGTGNNSLRADVTPDVVIDHHPIRRTTRSSPCTDVRSRYGATSSILWEYLEEAAVAPEPPLATSLLYGIRSDTQDLGRETTQADIDALLDLYPLANKRMLSDIEHAPLPESYYRLLAVALEEARVAGDAVYTGFGELDNPDMIAEVADLLARREGAAWTLCFGFCPDRVWLSLRVRDISKNAGRAMKRIVGRAGTGGGHHALAGGQIPLTSDTRMERDRVSSDIRKRFSRLVGVQDTQWRRLVEHSND